MLESMKGPLPAAFGILVLRCPAAEVTADICMRAGRTGS